jgi:hypothetical protein
VITPCAFAAACSSPSSAAYAKLASPSTEAPPTVAPVMATPFNKLSTFFLDITFTSIISKTHFLYNPKFAMLLYHAFFEFE